MGEYRLIHGDCLVELCNLPANSVDAIVTDPPYELGFMGKSWDSTGVAFSPETWTACLRVLKPGGHMLCFGGSRTFHRIACAIEDAGFELRDTVMWVYGSGFPKSHDVSKAIDKEAGAERVKRPNPLAKKQTASINTNDYGDYAAVDFITPEAATPDAAKWQGWGTALKPAFEPIILARKPFEGTVANNVLKWGTGAINVDGCRVAHNEECKMMAPSQANIANPSEKCKQAGRREATLELKPAGRWPANFIHDGSEEVLELMPETKSGDLKKGHKKGVGVNALPTYCLNSVYLRDYPGDSGSAARFFMKCDWSDDDCINANTAAGSLNLSNAVEDSVLRLVATRALPEGSVLKGLIQPFIQEMQKILRRPCESDTQQMKNIATKCLQELKQMNTARLSDSPAECVEIQGLTSTMTTILNLLNTGGFVEAVMSNSILSNMVLGEAAYLQRFNYCAKASKKDRDEGCEGLEEKDSGVWDGRASQQESRCIGNTMPGPCRNNHPTVKPTSLMRYLCKLITPPNGTILDPFMGSGSTGKAAMLEGLNFIGIEREQEYVEIAEARIGATTGASVAVIEEQPQIPGQLTLF